jgi:AraC-like DNA-binding protein
MVLNQSDMTVLGDPAAGDRARFRVLPGFGGTALFDADFHNFTFVPHFHDTLMLGLIAEGSKQFTRGGALHRVAAGGLSVVNPGDIHTGGIVRSGDRLRYTAVYPGAALLAEAGLPNGADFRAAVIDDPDLRLMFARALALNAAPAEAGEALLLALAGLAARYSHGSARIPAPCPKAVARAIDYIQSSPGAALRLEEIAARAEVGPRHLIRCFRHALGLTPQQYVRQARVSEAARRLRLGEALGQAALAAGFADQPHMTRTFRTVMGITPSAYAKSWHHLPRD